MKPLFLAPGPTCDELADGKLADRSAANADAGGCIPLQDALSERAVMTADGAARAPSRGAASNTVSVPRESIHTGLSPLRADSHPARTLEARQDSDSAVDQAVAGPSFIYPLVRAADVDNEVAIVREMTVQGRFHKGLGRCMPPKTAAAVATLVSAGHVHVADVVAVHMAAAAAEISTEGDPAVAAAATSEGEEEQQLQVKKPIVLTFNVRMPGGDQGTPCAKMASSQMLHSGPSHGLPPPFLFRGPPLAFEVDDDIAPNGPEERRALRQPDPDYCPKATAGAQRAPAASRFAVPVPRTIMRRGEGKQAAELLSRLELPPNQPLLAKQLCPSRVQVSEQDLPLAEEDEEALHILAGFNPESELYMQLSDLQPHLPFSPAIGSFSPLARENLASGLTRFVQDTPLVQRSGSSQQQRAAASEGRSALHRQATPTLSDARGYYCPNSLTHLRAMAVAGGARTAPSHAPGSGVPDVHGHNMSKYPVQQSELQRSDQRGTHTDTTFRCLQVSYYI